VEFFSKEMPTNTMSTLPFPGHVLTMGSGDSANVRAIQKRLAELGCGPVEPDGVFGADTMEAVELFQVRTMDGHGQPLTVDGRVGPMSWAALFGEATVSPVADPPTPLAAAVLGVAGKEVGVMEDPLGSNSGPRVNQYLASVGDKGGLPWCAAFVYWCFQEASAAVKIANPATRTAGALDVWDEAGTRGIRRVAAAEATERPGLVQPGMVFVIATGGGHGHVGLVERVAGVVLTTIEGNTNNGGSREGIGVFRRSVRRIGHINRGFVEYT
jgi:hypothetical protein